MGLAWTAMGGATLYIESRGRVPGADLVVSSNTEKKDDAESDDSSKETGGFGGGSLKVTGQLGSVMNESSDISLTYARLFMSELSPDNAFLDDARLHLNVPEGAVPKDGPSAGVTMTTSLMSLALNEQVRNDLAMTGELTLTGKILKVGGIKEKIIAARREGVTTLLLPRQNQADYAELKDYLKAGLTAHFCDHYDDVYQLAFDQTDLPALPKPPRGLPVVTVVTPATPVVAASVPLAAMEAPQETPSVPATASPWQF